MNSGFWLGKSVFLTGHTGFKGGWLSLWLHSLGARVHGYSTQAPTEPNLFGVADVARCLASHTIGDLRDPDALAAAMRSAEPDVVFHLAAQPLVRRSYADPIETYAVNVLGTVHLFEAVRQCTTIQAVVNVTTDKCYENKEWVWAYREHESLGGHDPYSSSKACAEIVTAAYRSSFFQNGAAWIATARAGNVIGGGDWAADRLVPDFFRAVDMSRPVEVRHPDATRPWQHVLEPLAGYLLLAQALATHGRRFATAWNFGPADEGARSVSWILDQLSGHLPGSGWIAVADAQVAKVHEAHFLKLDSSQAAKDLAWSPKWNLSQALARTVDWHSAWRRNQDMQAFCIAQITAHQNASSA